MANYAGLVITLLIGLVPALTLAGSSGVDSGARTVGVACLVILLFFLFSVVLVALGWAPRQLKESVDKLLVPPKERAPQPEIGIVALLQRIHPKFVTDPSKGIDGDVQMAAKATLDKITHEAALGQLTVFGKRQDEPPLKTDRNFTEIPAEYWRDREIGYMSVIDGTNGKVERRTGGSRFERYVELTFDKKQSRDVLGG